MAETERQRRARQVHDPRFLNYGHLGTATYDRNLQSWIFARQIQPPQTDNNEDLRAPENRQSVSTVFKLRNQELHTFDNSYPQRERQANQKTSKLSAFNFLKTAPDVTLVSSDITNSRLESALQEEDHGSSEHLRTKHIAYGSASRPDRLDNEIVPIVVTTTEPGSRNIRLIPMVNKSMEWEDDKGSNISAQAPGLGTNHVVHLMNTPGIPRQIIFHPNAGRDPQASIMAVRQDLHTTLFRPLAVGNDFDRATYADSGPRLRLLANPLLTIPANRTGGHPHVDIAFRPDDPNMLLIVDTHGNWSIWRLSRESNKVMLYGAELYGSGKIFAWEFEKPPSSVDLYYDGWHAATWLKDVHGNSDKFLVCDRQVATVFDMQSQLIGQVDLRIGLKRHGNWILDLKQSPTNSGLSFILTSSHLMVLRVTQKDDIEATDDEPVKVVCAWNHFRNPADTTLRMTLLETIDCIFVFLHSAKNNLVTLYQFGRLHEEAEIVSLADPISIHQHTAVEQIFRGESDILMSLTEVNCYDGDESLDGNLSFFSSFSIGKHGSILEALFEIESIFTHTKHTAEFPSMIHLPDAEEATFREDQVVDEDELADFIVEDTDFANQQCSGTDKKAIVKEAESELFARRPNILGQRHQDWHDILETDHSKPSGQDLTRFFKEANKKLRKTQRRQSSLQLLSDILASPHISNADEDLESIDQWLDHTLSRNEEHARVSDLLVRQVGSMTSKSLPDTYSDLLDLYLFPLSSNVNERARINRERLIREVAVDLLFSSLTISIDSNKPDHLDYELLQVEHDMRPQGQLKRQFDFSPIANLISPPKTLQQPTITDENQSPTESTPFSRLRKYTKFTRPNPTLFPQSESDDQQRAINNILFHLPTTFTNPSNYSYDDTVLNQILAQDEEATQSLDPRTRRRALKQAEKHRRQLNKVQQQRETQNSQLTALPTIASSSMLPATTDHRQIQSSQAMPTTYHSTGRGLLSPIPSSPPGLSSQLLEPMTQPERGVYGDRSADVHRKKEKAKKKKKRQGGF